MPRLPQLERLQGALESARRVVTEINSVFICHSSLWGEITLSK